MLHSVLLPLIVIIIIIIIIITIIIIIIVIIITVVAVLEKEISDVIHCKIQNIFLTTPSPSGSFTSSVWRSFQISLRKQRL